MQRGQACRQAGIAGLFLIIGILVLVSAVVGVAFYLNKLQVQKITDFESCAKMGNPVAASYPAQCNTKDGRHFVQKLSDEEQKRLDDQFKALESPIPSPSDETANWKVYSNNKFMYSFKYPPEASISAEMKSSVDGVIYPAPNSVELKWNTPYNPNSCKTFLLSFNVSKKMEDISLFGSPNIFDKDTKTKQVIVDNVTGLESTEELPSAYGKYQIGLNKNGFYYVIEGIPCFDKNSRKIIDTFKFLE